MLDNPELIFTYASRAAMLGWLVLILAPRFGALVPALLAGVIGGGLSVLYALLAMLFFAGGDGGFSSLEGVRSLFMDDHVLLAGWIHYLAVDLVVGCFIAWRSDILGISRIVQAPILFFTFMFGPVGFMIFLFLSLLWKGSRNWTPLQDNEEGALS